MNESAISVTEYATQRGCTNTAVNKAIKSGMLGYAVARDDDGTITGIYPNEADITWARKYNPVLSRNSVLSEYLSRVTDAYAKHRLTGAPYEAPDTPIKPVEKQVRVRVEKPKPEPKPKREAARPGFKSVSESMRDFMGLNPDEDGEDFTDVKTEDIPDPKNRAQALVQEAILKVRKQKIDIRKLEGSLADVDKVNLALADIAVTMRSENLNIPKQMAADLHACATKRDLENMLYQALYDFWERYSNVEI